MFQESFQRVIVAHAQHNAQLQAAWPYLCGGAHADFNDRLASLCYCLCYQQMHFESLTAIYNSGKLDAYSRPLIVDVGAGPATVALALAERHAAVLGRGPINLRYFDIERGTAMRAIATDYLADAALFRDVRRYSISDPLNMSAADGAEFANLGGASDVVLIALSYVLKQTTVDIAFAERIAEIANWCARNWTIPTFVLIQDKSAGPYERYDTFTRKLNNAYSLIEGGEGRLTQWHRQVRPDGTPTQQTPPPNRNVVYYFGRVSPTVY